MKLILAMTLTALLSLGCSHPLEIVNEGDILSSSGTRDCSLPQYRAGLDNCKVNIVTGDYYETYTAVARDGWVFDRWEGCFDPDPPVESCAFNIPADVVEQHTLETMPPLRAVFRKEGPQQWATQFVYWNVVDPPPRITNIDQEVWIAQTAQESSWPLIWKWRGETIVGGSLGLLQESAESGDALARFSLWNAIDATGDNCRAFDGRSQGYTCEIAVTIDSSKFYRLRVWLVDTTFEGRWWVAWLFEEDETGAVVAHTIGRIQMPQSYTAIDPASLANYSKYYGDSVPRCSEVPQSQAVFARPAVNYTGTADEYTAYAEYDSSYTPSGNGCRTITGGGEPSGAFTRSIPIEDSNDEVKAVRVFLGGLGGLEHSVEPGASLPPAVPRR